MLRPRLVGLDLDGTLLTGPRVIPDAHRELIRWFAAQDIAVCLLTGRSLLTTRWAWDELGLDSPLACFNGVWVGHPCTGATAEAPLNESEVKDILAVLAPYPGMRCAFPDPETWLVERFDHRTEGWPARYGVPIASDNRRFASWHGSSCKVMFVATPALIQEVTAVLTERFTGRYHVVISEPDRVEIHAKHATKGWALEHLATGLGIPREQVWAAGDADNDIEMLRWAGTGFAMPHASPGARLAADAVLEHDAAGALVGLRRRIETLSA